MRIRARVLRLDDLLRDDPARIAPLTDVAKTVEHNTQALRIGSRTPYLPPERDTSPGAGLSDDDAETLAGLNALLNARAGADLAKRRRAAVLPLVRVEALKLGVAFDPNVEGAHEALGACLMAYRKARQEVTERDAGEVVETPVVPPSTTHVHLSKGKARTLPCPHVGRGGASRGRLRAYLRHRLRLDLTRVLRSRVVEGRVLKMVGVVPPQHLIFSR